MYLNQQIVSYPIEDYPFIECEIYRLHRETEDRIRIKVKWHRKDFIYVLRLPKDIEIDRCTPSVDVYNRDFSIYAPIVNDIHGLPSEGFRDVYSFMVTHGFNSRSQGANLIPALKQALIHHGHPPDVFVKDHIPNYVVR